MTEPYVRDFQAFASNGAAGAPPWLREIREGAIARFTALGFPTMKQEAWRFTSVAPIAETHFTLPGSRRPQLALRDVAALSADGAFVHVAADTVLAQPLEVLFLATSGTAVTGAGGPTVSHPRSLFIVERGARATLIESYASIADGLQWTNAVTETVVGEGARVALYRVQREGRNAYHIATTQSRQERDSYLGLHVLTLGGSLARHDITTVLDGTGAELILNGLYVLGGSQHADHHTVIDHARPPCASHDVFNGVLAERAHGVFNGRIIVRPGAQRTDSKQTNNNLLLSTEARADSQPQLEIYADDVKCT